jgi:hypothetical protein
LRESKGQVVLHPSTDGPELLQCPRPGSSSASPANALNMTQGITTPFGFLDMVRLSMTHKLRDDAGDESTITSGKSSKLPGHVRTPSSNKK